MSCKGGCLHSIMNQFNANSLFLGSGEFTMLELAENVKEVGSEVAFS